MGQNDGGRKSYESTVMRMAGNIASGMMGNANRSWTTTDTTFIARASVELARAIVAEVLRTELPKEKE